MRSSKLMPNERRRLEVLKSFQVLNTPGEEVFDFLCRLAADICQTPHSCVSLVDQDRVWFRAKVGIDGDEVDRKASLCAQMIGRPAHIEYEDLACLPSFKNHPAVAGQPHFRFYAAHPLITIEGECIGLVVVLDTQPRVLSSSQREALRMLARLVMDQLELRRSSFRLEALNRELARKKEQKARLMAVLSHEVRNNLSAVLGFTELMEDGVDPTRLKRHAGSVRRCARHSVDILNSVLDSVHAEVSGRFQPLDLEVDLRKVSEEVLEDLEPLADAKGLRLSLEWGWDGPKALPMSRRALRQILMNLVNNAIKFTDAGSVLIRVLRRGTDTLRIEVVDTGRGVPNSAPLFEPFYRLNRDRTGIQNGSGLGLYVCKEEVLKLGGEIGFESRLGEGTCFWIHLPA